MIILGSVYFRKLIAVCDLASLQSYSDLVRPVLSETTGTEYVLSEAADPQKVMRWSEGIFNEPVERTMKFPRVIYGFRSTSGDRSERWIMDVFFSPIPHFCGVHANRRTEHTLPSPVTRELAVRLVESGLADTFDLKTDDVMLGTASGIYLYHKLRSIPLMRKRLESGKYTPPGSEVKDLLEVLPAILPEIGPSTTVMELPNQRSCRQEFLAGCDQRIITSLGKERLGTILSPTEITIDKWLRAGKGRFR